MKFSVLISVYCKEKSDRLDACLSSLLTQSLLPTEIIIIKDGPLTECLDSVIRLFVDKCSMYRVDLLVHQNNQNIGLAKSLKLGVELSSHNYIARMDSDDICFDDRFERQVELLKKGYEFVYGSSSEFRYKKNDFSRCNIAHNPKKIKFMLNFRNPIVHPSIIFDKRKIIELGSYRDFLYFEDYDLFLRVFHSDVKVINIREPLIHFRVGDEHKNRRHGWSYFKRGLSSKLKWLKEGNANRFYMALSIIPFFVFCFVDNNFKSKLYNYLRD